MRTVFKLSNIIYFYQKFSALEQKLFIISICLGLVGLFGLLGNLYFAATIPVPVYGGHLREGIVGRPTNLNPIMPAENDADRDLRALIHSGLIGLDQEGNFRPQLAQSLPNVSEDLKTYTIKLRKNLRWQDGKPITADDVLYTIASAQSKETGMLRFSYKFVQTEKLDDYTVRFELREPSANFSENLLIGLLPVHLSQSYDNLRPIGAGAYKIKKIKYKNSREIIAVELVANEFYYPHRPFLNRITLKFFNTSEELETAYRNRDIESFGKTADHKNINLRFGDFLQSIKQPQYQAVLFNTDKSEILKSLRVRQALRLATDKQAVIEKIFDNNASLVGAPVVGHISVPPSEYSPEKAGDLLGQDGWQTNADGLRYKNNKPLRIVLATSDILVNIKTAYLLREQWRKVGTDLEIRTYNQQDFFEKALRPREYEAVLIFENSGHDADPYYFWHSSQVADPGLNFAILRSNEVDKTIVEARETRDAEKRKILYQKFISLVNAESPGVFLAQPHYLYVTTGIQNINISGLSLSHERFANVHEWFIKSGRKFDF